MRKMFIISMVCVGLILVGANAYAQQANADASVNGVVAGSSITTSSGDVFNRNFVNPGNTPLPMTNGFFTAPTPDSSFRSIRDILANLEGDGAFEMRISESALKEIAKGADVEGTLQIIKDDVIVPRVYTKDTDKKDRILTIAIEKPIFGKNEKGETVVVGTADIEGLQNTGLVDGEADDGDTNSFQVLAERGLKVLADGNNYMVVTSEGAHRKVEASGWGVGTYGVYGGVSDTGKESGAGGGGTGYASNETGPEDRPWFQGYCGVKY
jgi:hypothetical protein